MVMTRTLVAMLGRSATGGVLEQAIDRASVAIAMAIDFAALAEEAERGVMKSFYCLSRRESGIVLAQKVAGTFSKKVPATF
jgi:hypothetical protein